MSVHEVQLRWRDIDGLGHVNHPVVLTYLEEGRDAFLAGCGIGREEYVVGRCSVSFDAEIDLELGFVTVECEVAEVGTSSVKTRESIMDEGGNTLVSAEFGIVLWDPDRKSPRPITDEERAALEKGEL